ncbi:hypothetical protein ABZ760_11975 [Streptomyces sp. NPDC006658]|uniref:hypothetical protein n=1 Tax=Streptomyces sp. NPDC006658 TaxID=3156900 RepID=UPI0033C1A10F
MPDTASTAAWVRWLPKELPAAGHITLDNSSDQSLDITKISDPGYQNIRIYQAVTGDEGSKMIDPVDIDTYVAGEYKAPCHCGAT